MARALLLCAGYGTRLERDIRSDDSGEHAHLIGVNKALVPLPRHSDVLGVCLAHLAAAKVARRDTYLVCNAVHAQQFETRLAGDEVTVVNDGSTDNATRLGAVGDMRLAVRHMRADDDRMRSREHRSPSHCRKCPRQARPNRSIGTGGWRERQCPCYPQHGGIR